MKFNLSKRRKVALTIAGIIYVIIVLSSYMSVEEVFITAFIFLVIVAILFLWVK